MFISICCKYILTKNCLLRGSALFLSMGSLKTRKMMKNRMKKDENSRIFQMFQFCSILGVFQGNLRQLGGVFGLSRGVLATSWGVLEASWRLLGGSWRRLGGVLEVSWRRLGASWTCLGENVKKMLSAPHFWEGF